MAISTRRALVDRVEDFDRVRAAFAGAASGRTRTVLLGGEAGIGKSRLIEEFVDEARGSGAFIAAGASLPATDGEIPFASIVEILRSTSRQLERGDVEAIVGPVRDLLAPLLPSMGEASRPDVGSGGRTALFEAILGSVERLAEARGPVVLVLEDLHWADRSTRELLAYLVHNLRDAPVLLIATYRTDDLVPGHPLRVLLAELDRAERVQRWELRRFSADDVRAQIRTITSREPDGALVAKIAGRSDGNPFFAEELLAALEGNSNVIVPETLREVLRSRIVALPPQVDQLLRVCAVAGPRIDYRLLTSVLDTDPAELARFIRDAIGRNLLVPVRDEDGEAVRFRQTLVRDAIYDDLVPVERMRYHAAIASVLAAHPEFLAGPSAVAEGVVARHWLQAGALANARTTLVRAGLAAERAFAFPEAAQAFETALRIWEAADGEVAGSKTPPARGPIGFQSQRTEQGRPGGDRPTPAGPTRDEVIRHAAESLSLSGDPGRAAQLLRQLTPVGGAASATGDPTTLATDLLHLGRYLAEDGDLNASLDAYEHAGEHAPTHSLISARVGAAKASAFAAIGRFKEARGAADEAMRAAAAAGSDSVSREAEQTLGVALVMEGEVESGLEHLAAARRALVAPRHSSVIRPRPSRIGDLVRGFASHAAVLERAGQQTEVAATMEEGADLARRLGVESTWGAALNVLGAKGRYHLGQWDEADAETRELLEQSPGREVAARLHLIRAMLATGRGAFDDAAVHLETARTLLPRVTGPELEGEVATAEAELAIWRSQLTEARDVVDRAIGQLNQAQDVIPIISLAWAGLRAEADRAEGARVRRANVELAEASRIGAALRAQVIALRERFADRAAVAPRQLRVVAALVDAEWTRLERPSDPDAWSTAASRAIEIRDPWLAAYAQWRQAEALLGGREGRGPAQEVARSAYATASELGAEPLRKELEALARRARLDLAGPAPADLSEPPKPSARDTLGLTERELEVLALVAEGYTNRRIAETLFITEKTAGHHVSNLLGKLGAATRVEAAAMAHRLGLLDEVVRPA